MEDEAAGTLSRASSAHDGSAGVHQLELRAHALPPSRDSHGPPPSANAVSPAFFTSAQWTADGTSLVTGASDNKVSIFVLPHDLLSPEADQTRPLTPYSTTQLPEPTQAIAASPYFSLADPQSQTFMVGCRDHPLQLYHALSRPDAPPGPIANYKLVKRETEEYITPASLLWSATASHIICGSANRLDYFDVSRYGADEPVLTVPTIPSRRHLSKGGGVGMKGTVAALAASPYDANVASIIAAGTRTRWLGLYDIFRTDRALANWSVAGASSVDSHAATQGQGIVQLLWSPCGRYLVVNERHARSLLVYDIRVTGKLLSVLSGRTTTTQQKLLCDCCAVGSNGLELWAGTESGDVLFWDDIGRQQTVVPPAKRWKAHASPVGSAALHSSAAVLATCSGGWEHAPDSALRASGRIGTGRTSRGGCRVMDDSSLKIWSIDTGG